MSAISFGLRENSSRKTFFDYPKFSSSVTVESLPSEVYRKTKLIDYSVAFEQECKSYCIGCVDMVNSTKISAQLGTRKISRYYQIFLNSMSQILSEYGGMVIKNVGDCLMYYFPSSAKQCSTYGFRSCVECNLALIEAHDFICEQLYREDLPCLDYRVSSDYGSVCIMQSNTSSSLDMIGPPVNMCSKINHIANPNEVVIGGDLQEMAKTFKEYSFKPKSGYSLGYKCDYPVYAVSRKLRNS